MPNLARNTHALTDGERPRIPDDPIDYSVPYQSRIAGAARHYGFLPFFAKKPWPVVQAYINHYTSPGDLVGDAFSGSGVTPVESLVLGRRAVATDINPIARFITRMTAVAPVDLELFRATFEQVRAIAQRPIEALDSMPVTRVDELLETLTYPHVSIPGTVRRAGAETVDQLHTPRQLAGLAILRSAIGQIADELMRDLLLSVFVRTLKYTNKTYTLPLAKEGEKRRSPYAGDAAIFRRNSYSFAKGERFFEHQVWPTFVRNFDNVIRAKEETNHLIGRRYNATNFRLGDVPASRIHELTGDETVDYFFTDPPYSNEIYFVDLSTLWAAWLGFELTDQISRDELIIKGVKKKSREQFIQEFAASMQSISRALKQDRWFTLVYKHSDLSLWQSIVAACEQCGLRYINSVWQDLKIKSTRQHESPNKNPSGDMYLNFRKMSPRKFQKVYPRAAVLDLPTRPTYVEKEIERLIVSYLSADTQLITAGVIQQILDSRAFRNYRENPANLSQDIGEALRKPRFTTWKPGLWVMNPGVAIDLTLPAIDRARYYVFEFLKERGEATEGEVSANLLTRFSEERGGDTELVNRDVRSLLIHVGREIKTHVWRFEEDSVLKYQQLRLFFQRSRADEIRERIEEREAGQSRPLNPDFEGIALLLERLRIANADNRDFDKQSRQLLVVLNTMLHSLANYRDELIEEVRAVGEWAQFGIDFRNAAFEDVLVQIVLRSDERPFELYREISQKVFGNLDDGDLLVQFRLATLPEWEQATKVAQGKGSEDNLGILLLGRT